MWRLGSDFGFGTFVIRSGVFSHWQTWLAVAGAVQCLSVVINENLKIEPAAAIAPKNVLRFESRPEASDPTELLASVKRPAKILQFPAPDSPLRRSARA